MISLYCIYNKINEKRYVGQTSVGISTRWLRHQYDSHKSKCQEYPLYRALTKYGIESFDLLELGSAQTQETADNLEKIWIILLQSQKHALGYNIREGGHRGKNSPETRAKISAAQKGKPNHRKGAKASPETRLKIGMSKLGNTNCVGRILSAETKAKIGAKSKGRIHSEETRKKISEAVKKIRAERFWSTR